MASLQTTYTYALLPPDAMLVLPEGIAGALQRIPVGSLDALVEVGLDIETLQSDDARLMRAVLHHDQVIREAFEQTDLLPLRFGTCFRSQTDLENHLQDNADAYLAKLAKVKGKAEYTVRLKPVVASASAIPAEAGGKAYFLAKKRQFQEQFEQQQQRQQQRDVLREAIAQIYPHLFTAEPRDGMERLYFLADFSRGNGLAEPPQSPQGYLEQWQALCPLWEVMLDAPLPPYHFV
ncbi:MULTISPECIES: GvpL/GvpF family gas vesicle protein [unclassified Leptolyngbya]|uniref:GvpL/GvpF family gas vesicle protein n=1 Tax=unclassified Leptolyngbya TaxID=2650499 RepID=UPI001683D946|nr:MULTISPECIES: GvpL/GvpF family gas vesicle protein [unclassified Leptolyngbya]MBD1912909.1 GvpL/GvpF family gas vesicle protein [Leptolyngbya sp. FACHB-8]MBD2154762.1 GvpL/GvpF family gas vesicle protein [Leptolyngbya sp. FACHB-16]